MIRNGNQGITAGFTVGLVVSLIFTFARYAGVESVVGIPVLVNPALYGVPTAFLAAIVVSLLTKDVGAVDHFMHMAHDRDGTIDGTNGQALAGEAGRRHHRPGRRDPPRYRPRTG